MSSISYIIPCFINDEETLEITKNAVVSCKESAPYAQMVLIDNGSTIGGGYLRSQADVYVRFLGNRGYTYGVNAGLGVASGEILAIVNNDIRISPNWYHQVVPILNDRSVATVHLRMTDYDQPFVYGAAVIKSGKERWCQNSCVITTRRFLNQMGKLEECSEPYPGRFDLNFGIGGGYDDWDFYFRVRRYGRTVYTDKACFQHKHSHTLKKLGPNREKVVRQNREYFIEKYGKDAETLFALEFPEQMHIPYWKGFEL